MNEKLRWTVEFFLCLIGLGFVLFFSGCANVSTTRFVYRQADGSSVSVEMPKEMEAKDLVVDMNAKLGTAKVTASAISTKNVATINAQAAREAATAKAISEGAAQGAVQGAAKVIMP